MMEITTITIIALAWLFSGTWFPVVLIFWSKPPERGTWWYPDPDRFGYQFKLLLFAFLDVNTGSPEAKWFARSIAVVIGLGGLGAAVGAAMKTLG